MLLTIMAAVIKQKQNNYKLRSLQFRIRFRLRFRYRFVFASRRCLRRVRKKTNTDRTRRSIRNVISLNLSWKAGERKRQTNRRSRNTFIKCVVCAHQSFNLSLTHSLIHSFAIIKQNLQQQQQRKRKQSAKTSESHETKNKKKNKRKRKS